MINGLIKLTGWVFRVMAYQRRLGVVSAVACDWGGGSGGAGGWLGGWGGWGVVGTDGRKDGCRPR